MLLVILFLKVEPTYWSNIGYNPPTYAYGLMPLSIYHIYIVYNEQGYHTIV